MLTISDIKLGSVAKVDGEPYVVIWTQHVQMGRGGAILRTKIRNLITGAVLEKTLKGQDKWESADLQRTKATFLYIDEQVHFMDQESYEQFSLEKENIGDQVNYLKEGLEVSVLNFEGKPVSIQLPTKIKLKVTDAPPGVKGDTAGTASKQITLETGFVINAPLFINEGDEIVVNTEQGTYVERAKD